MHLALLAVHVFLLYALPCVAAVGRTVAARSTPTKTTPPRHSVTQQAAGHPGDVLFRRDVAIDSQLITCGYLNGNVNEPRTAQPGFDCRVDTQHGIWGFCPSTVIAATDCGLAAACRDSGTCSSICRFNAASGLTTITCPSSGTSIAYCSTAMLTFGVDQSYAYVACGNDPQTQHYIINPTFTPTTSTSIISTSTPTTSTSTTSSSSSSKTSTAQKSAPSPTDSSTTTPLTSPTPAAVSSGDTPASPSPSPASGSSTNVGAIIGGVLGGLALLCGSAVAVVFIMKRNRSSNNKKDGSSSASSSSSPPSISPSTTPFPPAPPYAPHAQHRHGMHGGTPPPRPPPPQQVYPTVYHEVDSSTEKYKPSFEHNRGYEGYTAYAVELPSNNNQ